MIVIKVYQDFIDGLCNASCSFMSLIFLVAFNQLIHAQVLYSGDDNLPLVGLDFIYIDESVHLKNQIVENPIVFIDKDVEMVFISSESIALSPAFEIVFYRIAGVDMKKIRVGSEPVVKYQLPTENVKQNIEPHKHIEYPIFPTDDRPSEKTLFFEQLLPIYNVKLVVKKNENRCNYLFFQTYNFLPTESTIIDNLKIIDSLVTIDDKNFTDDCFARPPPLLFFK